MAPSATLNSLFALFVPLGVLLLAIQLNREERFALLPGLIGIGLLSAALGLLQTIGPEQGPFYFHRVTNYGWAVGLFANRNHHGLLLACLIPMLAVYAKFGKFLGLSVLRTMVVAAVGAIFVVLILLTGSRSGLVMGMIGLVSIPLLLASADGRGLPRTRRYAPLIFGILSLLGIMIVAVSQGRADALLRVLAPDVFDDTRFQIWGPIADMASKYFPVGSGLGAFVESYKIDEADALLTSTYLNHAHNDWLEFFLGGGALALALILAAFIAWLVPTIKCWCRSRPLTRGLAYQRLGSVLVLLVGLASIFDYPLRVPSVACAATLFVVWLRGDPIRRTSEAEESVGGVASSHRISG